MSIDELAVVIGGLVRKLDEVAAKVDVLIERARDEDGTYAMARHEVRRQGAAVEELRDRVHILETHPRLIGNGAHE